MFSSKLFSSKSEPEINFSIFTQTFSYMISIILMFFSVVSLFANVFSSLSFFLLCIFNLPITTKTEKSNNNSWNLIKTLVVLSLSVLTFFQVRNENRYYLESEKNAEYEKRNVKIELIRAELAKNLDTENKILENQAEIDRIKKETEKVNKGN